MIRTCDLPLRRGTLYPAELPGQTNNSTIILYALTQIHKKEKMSLDKQNNQSQKKFIDSLGFMPDPFQLEAFEYVDRENNVLVAAPTGAGKTVVGEYSIFKSFNSSSSQKVFYTTPIKALSNQKYYDLVKVYGEENVGLITGDTVINSESRIVVMTTEVLRNMLYASSSTLTNLRTVIMDEVHYLSDRSRGSVWEEVIIHLPMSCNIIALSATVSNVEELASWLRIIRNNCETVISEKRPIKLTQMIALNDGIYDLYNDLTTDDSINRVLISKMKKEFSSPRHIPRRRSSLKGRKSRGRSFPNARATKTSGRQLPKRQNIISELNDRGMLPCIYFIFSRKGCDDALKTFDNLNISLTSYDEQQQIIHYLDNNVRPKLDLKDLDTLNYDYFTKIITKGFATHHAGIIQLFREAIEKLFERGLIKVVFATETLALGVNMPAKTVVIEKLVKFDGISQQPITPGQFTQFTGRAGRRGKDTNGYAVVVDQKDLTPGAVALLSSRRVFPLVSSFAPNYNMTVNLLKNSDIKWAENILKSSYAQYQLDHKSTSLQKLLKDYQSQKVEIEKQLAQASTKKVNANQKDPQAVYRHRINRADAKINRVKKELLHNNTILVNEFNKICNILYDFNYLKKPNTITKKGEILSKINCEHEVLLIECLLSHVFDKLLTYEIAGILSTFISVSKHSSLSPKMSSPLLKASENLIQIWKKIQRMERHYSVSDQRVSFEPNFSLINAVSTHAQGYNLEQVTKKFDKSTTFGDFIRCAKGVIDIANQLYRVTNDDRFKEVSEIMNHSIIEIA